jgi:hypothetical protein
MSGTGSFTGSTGAVDATDISISGTGTFTAPSGEFTVSGNWSKTGGTFTAGSNTVTFDAGAIGKTITPGGSSFYDITFDNASGGWTISGAMTVTHDFRLTTGAVTQSSTLAVTHDYIQTGGTFAATSPNTNTMTVGNSFSIPATSGAFNRFTGSGASAIDPYLVYDVYGLQGMRGYLAGGKYFKLNDNIVATGTANWNTGAGFVPVGNDTAAFTGNFDGNIKTISGLTMARTLEKRVGLFGSTSGATVRNVGLVGGSTSGTNTQQAYVGSLIGQADNTTIANAYATGNVSGSGDYNYGVGFGGLVGFNYNNSSVTDSYATGDVNGNANVGGLVGRNWSSAVIADSRAEGDVTASSISVGGLVGEQQGTVNSSYATGNVASTNAYVGGLAGYNSGTINYSYATGNVNAPTGWDVGGLAGFNYYGTISNSYATGSVNGGSQVGGLVGLDDVNATVTNSYSKGNVSGTGADVGGLIGRYEAGAVLTNNYWDYETAGMAQTLDTGNNGDVAGITGMTIAEMKQQATFLGWDFGNVWAIDEGNVYPTLQHQYYVWTGTGNTSLGSNWNKGVAPGASDWVFFNNSGTNNATVDSIFTVGKLAIGSGYTGTITQSNALNVSGNYTQGGGTFSGSAAMDVDGNFTLTGGTFTAPTTLNVGGDWIRSGGTFTPGTRTVIFDAGATGKTITSGGSSFYDLQFNNASGGWTILDPMNVTHDMTLTTGAVTQSSTLAITHDYIQAGGTFAATTPDTNTMTIGNSFSIPDTAGAFNRFGGSGTSGSPYLIYDVYGLQGMKGYLASGTYFQIANDIVAGSTSAWNSGAGFDAIGNFTAKFGGNFNGNSKTITGLAINRPTEDYIGLFGYTNAATIQNVGLVGGSVSGSASVGGLVGRNESSAITSSYATGSVSGDAQVGGLAGESDETSNIANSYSTGNVSGAFRVGGLVGNSKFSSITNSYATGIVSGSGSFSGSSGSVGGLVGQNYDSTIENSFSTGVVTSTNDTPGGVVGYYTGGTLTSNYWDTQISGLSNGFGTGSTSGVTGKTTAEMKQQATFSGWDFGSTWKIYEGLAAPLLKSFLTPLTVTANASTETYNGTTAFAGNGVNYSLVPSAELLGTVSFTSPSKNVGTYVGGLTPTGLYSTQQGYDITYVGGDLTITPRMLNVSATGTDKVYDATTHAAVTLSDNRILGDVLTGLYAAASFDDKNVGTGKNVSVSGIEISGTDAGNYTLVSSAATATADITPLEISVSGVTANNKVYDATTTATVNTGSASLVGVLGGDVVGLDASGKSGVFANKNVGTGKAVTVSGLGLSGTDAGNYTLGQPVGITADITQATLTWSGVTANNKTYDGTIVATVSGGTLTGKLGSDNVTVNSTGAFGDKNVGASKTVTLLNELNGADAANYALVDQTTTTADITALGITVSGVTVNHKVYDATAAATVNTGSAALVGVLGGDTVSLDASGKSGVFANKNVGTGKSVTVSGLGLSGTDAINYALSQPVGITADITALGITVSGVTADSKVYDATTVAAVNTGSAALVGVLGGDTVDLDDAAKSGVFADKNVGTDKGVTVSGLALSGTDALNYTLSQPVGLTADITKASVTLTGITVNNKVYDATTAATTNTAGATFTGKLGSDVLTVISSTGAFEDKNVGMGKTVTLANTLGGADLGNYDITDQTTTTANITAKALTVSGVTASNKVYDATTAANLNTGSATLMGVVGGDSVNLNAGVGAGIFADKNAGTGKAVTISGLALTGTDASNYSLIQPAGLTADITKASVTLTGITASNKTYDATTVASVSGGTFSGKYAGDDLTVSSTGVFIDKHVGTGKTVTLTNVIGGADLGNYNVTDQGTTTANITAKALTISGVTASNKVYDATTTAAVDAGSAVLFGILGGDLVTLGGVATGAFVDKNVGTGKGVTVSGLALSGTDASNYTLSQPVGLTADITRASVTLTGITASNKTYDATTVATVSGGTFSGKYAGDVLTVSSTGVFSDKNVGTGKTVTLTNILGGADLGNYDVTDQTTTTANITAKALTVSGVTVSNKVYDATTAATVNTGSASLVGVLGGDTVSLDTVSKSGAFGNKNVGTGKSVTVSGLSLAGGDASNYAISQPTGLTADITKASVTLSGITASNKTYDQTLTATVSTAGAVFAGKYAGDVLTVSSTGVFSDKNAGNGKTVFLSNTLGGADLANYDISDQGTTTANITARPLTITATGVNKVYDGGTTATVNLSDNRLANDVLTASYTTAVYADGSVGTAKPITVSGISITGADALNYIVDATSTAFADITAAPVTVTTPPPTAVDPPPIIIPVTPGPIIVTPPPVVIVEAPRGDNVPLPINIENPAVPASPVITPAAPPASESQTPVGLENAEVAVEDTLDETDVVPESETPAITDSEPVPVVTVEADESKAETKTTEASPEKKSESTEEEKTTPVKDEEKNVQWRDVPVTGFASLDDGRKFLTDVRVIEGAVYVVDSMNTMSLLGLGDSMRVLYKKRTRKSLKPAKKVVIQEAPKSSEDMAKPEDLELPAKTTEVPEVPAMPEVKKALSQVLNAVKQEPEAEPAPEDRVLKAALPVVMQQTAGGDRYGVLKNPGKDVFVRSRDGEWLAAKDGMIILPGDEVKTARDNSVEMLMDGGKTGRVEIKEGSLFRIQKAETDSLTGDKRTLLELAMGKILVKVEALKGNSKFEVRTPTALTGVRGTVFEVTVKEKS